MDSVAMTQPLNIHIPCFGQHMLGNTILVADDEVAIVDQLSDAFTKNGYSVIRAQNGLEAWTELFRFHPDDIAACVIDLQMPPGTYGGTDLVAKIRAAYSRQLPIAIYSGRGTISSSHEVTRAGADAFIEKEAGIQQLVDTVMKVIAVKTRPADPLPSSINELARVSDLPSLTLRSLRNFEQLIRSTLLARFTPADLLTLSARRGHKLPTQISDKLRLLSAFAHDDRLSLGDILEIVASAALLQIVRSPSANEIRSVSAKIVPIRNALFHGRSVDPKDLLVAILSLDDLINKLRTAP